MRLDRIGTDHYILTDDSAFINLTREQVRKIWQNLHLDYTELFLFIGEEVLSSRSSRRTLQVLVDHVGDLVQAMQLIETRVVEFSKDLKVKRTEGVRTQAHATVKPIPESPDPLLLEAPTARRMGAVPLLPSLPIEEIPTAPVFHWEPRLARRRGVGRILGVVE